MVSAEAQRTNSHILRIYGVLDLLITNTIDQIETQAALDPLARTVPMTF